MPRAQQILTHAAQQQPHLLPLLILLQGNPLQGVIAVKEPPHGVPGRADLVVVETPRNGGEVARFAARGALGVHDDVGGQAGEVGAVVEGGVGGREGKGLARVGGGPVCGLAGGFEGDALEAGLFGGLFGCAGGLGWRCEDRLGTEGFGRDG